ncbi:MULTISPECIES: SipW-dependent-type signal peptide-containing protein [unclassified Rhodococcus (in: high G+C Gram-positive bacteria)]|uniref:SipW-dependent-type signal peptide-containing protein n=1 Tax=unclassified Rhodococcus (in: high G+C Gram-positive bacteria) TaxID=192944 RepID=UPI000B5A5829|nr:MULTISPECIES: SipW-dependent-type signal peptide-containing protein [unclassified Rhodococcus (in: high G+C Gram-positive bacteria)]MDC3728681.1 hypothetical protein [Rhodococcus sp. Rp3]OWY79539.1 hypothetical protein B9C99_22275 [Rhodococcus sp. BUPNP1]WSE21741.1 SipW-dependent-type signal peptide-containing protein [Rhodococcus sp. PD04]
MTIDNADNKAQKRRKVRAILASGLVLGVGAAVTLAAWNDSVWGNAEFGTGGNTWNVQGSFGGTEDWDEFVTSDEAGTFAFAMNPTEMAAGDSVYAKVGLRVVSEKLGAEIGMPAAQNLSATSKFADVLQLKVAPIGPSANCNADAVKNASDLVANGSVRTASIPAKGVTIPANGQQWLCFAVTLPNGTTPTQLGTPNAQGGYNASLQWEFQAVSPEA